MEPPERIRRKDFIEKSLSITDETFKELTPAKRRSYLAQVDEHLRDPRTAQDALEWINERGRQEIYPQYVQIVGHKPEDTAASALGLTPDDGVAPATVSEERRLATLSELFPDTFDTLPETEQHRRFVELLRMRRDRAWKKVLDPFFETQEKKPIQAAYQKWYLSREEHNPLFARDGVQDVDRTIAAHLDSPERSNLSSTSREMRDRYGDPTVRIDEALKNALGTTPLDGWGSERTIASLTPTERTEYCRVLHMLRRKHEKVVSAWLKEKPNEAAERLFDAYLHTRTRPRSKSLPDGSSRAHARVGSHSNSRTTRGEASAYDPLYSVLGLTDLLSMVTGLSRRVTNNLDDERWEDTSASDLRLALDGLTALLARKETERRVVGFLEPRAGGARRRNQVYHYNQLLIALIDHIQRRCPRELRSQQAHLLSLLPRPPVLRRSGG